MRLRFERIRERVASHKMELMIQPDKDWEIYARL
jgi:hypothetical protein